MRLLRWALLELMLLRFLLAVLAAGQEAEGSGPSEAISTERAMAFRFEAKHTVTVESFKFKTPAGVASTATSVRVGICADLAGEPGALIGAEGVFSGTPAKEALEEVTGLSCPVVAGSFYHLVVLPLGGNLRLKSQEVGKGTSASFLSPKTTTIAAATWPSSTGQGPAYLAALGTESSGTAGHVTMVA